MRFEIVELVDFSGRQAGIYSVILGDDNQTLFDQFITENEAAYPLEINSIIKRLDSIGHVVGARESFFKFNEGKPGDGLCALYDTPERKLRLYCIRYGSTCIILGGGGPKNVRALQENEKLRRENYLLRAISQRIIDALIEGDLSWSGDGTVLLGKLTFDV